MRVAFIDQAGDQSGGAQRSLAILLRALPADIQPHAILFGDGAFAAGLRASGIPVTVVPLPPAVLATTREHPATGIAALPSAIVAVARAIRGVGADLVHTNTIKAHAVASPAARLAGVPCVAHLRDILDGRGRIAIRSVLAACSRERIAISHAVDAAFGLGATSVIANPLELDDYRDLPSCADARRRLGLPAGTLVSLIGRINRWKGHDRLIRIVARLHALPDLHAAIVGAPLFRDADFVAELHALVEREGLRERVHFVPWLDDVRVAYAATDINLNCSEAEPFGRTIIEAAACGVPSIAFAGGGTSDAIIDGHTGRIVPAGDETAFARAIEAYATDPQLLDAARAHARDFAQTFAAPVHASRVATILRRVAA